MAYTYLIGWSALGLWYYGVRYARGCSVGDLWKTYFTSSLEVKRMRGEHGEPDVVEVRRVFDDPAKAREWEDRVLRRTGAVKSPRWINASNGGHEFNSTSSDTRAKISAAKKGVVTPRPPTSEETKKRISEAAKGRKCNMTPEQLAARAAKISAAKTGVKRAPFTPEAIENMKRAQAGRTISDLHRARISASKRARKAAA